MAEKVVPRSMPTTLRVLMTQNAGLRWLGGVSIVQFSCPRGMGICTGARSLIDARENESTEAFCDHFLGADQLATPDEAALHAHHDRAVFFRKVGRLVTDHAMTCTIDPFARLDFPYVEAMKNFD